MQIKPPPPVRLGIDLFLANPQFRASFRRIGLITSDAARLGTSPLTTARLGLVQAGLPVVKLFAPEHGITASAKDGSAVADAIDPLTGIPVASLYGPRLEPALEAIADVDAIVFDLQDIGIRFYTFIWTLFHAMASCTAAERPLIVLDRPNPLGGGPDTAEGPILDQTVHGSFLGRSSIPVRHGLTVGELARLWQKEHFPGIDLRVVEMEGWEGRPPWPATGLPFHAPSPGIPHFDSAFFYGSTAWFEATNLSVGRGTHISFQTVGSPWFRPAETADHFNRQKLPGVRAEPVFFTPAEQPHANQPCAGIQLLKIPTPESFRPVEAGLFLVAAVIAIHPDHFKWSNYPTSVNPGGKEHFEKLIGVSGIRESLMEKAADLSSGEVAGWTAIGDWAIRSTPALLYP